MSIRFIHLADIHYDRENQDAAAKSIEAAIEAGTRERIDFWTLAGDLFNRGIQNSAVGGFPRLLDLVAHMLEVAPIYAVSGTVTHDLAGCYEALQKMGGFMLLTADGAAYGMTKAGEKYMVLGLPEAGKEWFLAGADGLSAEEANEKVKAGMRSILLGLGAKRAEHPEMPAVMLYHGAIVGAEMANGQLVEGGISIGREDLALVGADYYALGHIHLRQQIPGLPAWYSGSAYPVNWGELDQKGCNLVEIDLSVIDAGPVSDRATVTALPFPHAPRKKIVVDWAATDSPYFTAEDVDGFQAWLLIRKPKDALLDTEFVESNLALNGALPGSRVTVETIPTETVRAAEITEKHHLREKAIVYAEASGEAAPVESVLAKADTLERAAESRGAGQGAYIRLRKLRLRGAIGIWKGQRQDEIELDFDGFDPGLIALIGETGAGKTTL
ncbi:MAG: metallophosphoesterase, partial [Candidatus Bipolaricaulota bacterium]|nr:metallophosphoesterase [Candidatus Bipolaricaulota bacterium]